VPLRSLRPLDLQVLGGHHDSELLDGAMGEQFGRHPQRERRFPGSGSGHGQEIARLGGQVLHQRPALPAPQRPVAGMAGIDGRVGPADRLHRHSSPRR
jgi:hypothetical protein